MERIRTGIHRYIFEIVAGAVNEAKAYCVDDLLYFKPLKIALSL